MATRRTRKTVRAKKGRKGTRKRPRRKTRISWAFGGALGALATCGMAIGLMRTVIGVPEEKYQFFSQSLGLPLLLIPVAAVFLFVSLKSFGDYSMLRPPKKLLGKDPSSMVKARPRKRSKRLRIPWIEILAVAALTLVGAWFRLTGIHSLPSGFFFDEAQNGLEALKILHGGERPIYIGGLSQVPAFFMYEVALMFGIMGKKILAVRLVSILSGILCIPLFYLLARQMASRGPALAGTAILAILRWHINFSRVGFLGVQTVLFEIAGMLFLWRAVKGRKTSDFVASGVFLGLGLHSYFGSRFVPIIFILWGAYLWIREKSTQKRLRKFLDLPSLHHPAIGRGCLALVGSALLVFSPLMTALGPYAFSRTGSASIYNHISGVKGLEIFAAPEFWSNVMKHLLMFFYIGDGNGRHNVPGWPLLEPVVATLFLFGALLALLRLWDSRGVLALILGAVMLQGGIWSVPWEAPQAYRTIGAIPMVVILSVLALEFLGKALATLNKPVWLGPLILIPALMTSGWNSYREYFYYGPRDQAVWAEYNAVETHIGHKLRALKDEPGTKAFFSPRYANHPTIKFISGGWDEFPRLDFGKDFPIFTIPEGPMVIFLENSIRNQLPRFRKLYPEVLIEPLISPANAEEVMYMVRIHPEDIKNSFGLDKDGRGSLWVNQEGPVVLSMPGGGKVRLNGRSVDLGSSESSFVLPWGGHPIEVLEGSSENLRVAGGILLKALDPGGLWGRIEETDEHGKRFLARRGVDPVIFLTDSFSPLRDRHGPFWCHWEGTLIPDEPGVYLIGVKSSGVIKASIAGQGEVGPSKPHYEVQREFRLNGPTAVKVDVEFSGLTGHFAQLYWQKPDGTREIIPEANLKGPWFNK